MYMSWQQPVKRKKRRENERKKEREKRRRKAQMINWRKWKAGAGKGSANIHDIEKILTHG